MILRPPKLTLARVSVGLLSFTAGVFFVVDSGLSGPQLRSNDTAQVSVEDLLNTTEQDTPVQESFRYGCSEKTLESVWEQTNLEAIGQLKRKEIKVFNLDPDSTSYPDRERYRSELAEFEKTGFDCSIFEAVEDEIDLDGDGQKELFVMGQITSNRADSETYVLRLINERWEPILFDKGRIEREVLTARSKGFLNLEFRTNWSGGGRLISIYKYDGRVYRPSNCFAEDHMVERKGEMVLLDTPERKPTKCNRLDNLL